MKIPSRRIVLGVVVPAALVAASFASSAAAKPTARVSSTALVGTLKITAGGYSGGRATGSWFRMQFPGGSGYFENPNSSATDKTYTPVAPGTDGGLVSGRYQTDSTPAFSSSGSSRAGAIIRPTGFAGLNFGLRTWNSQLIPAPSISYSGSTLTARIPSLTAAWNKLYFNQGAPKPLQSGRAATGTYNPTTKAYTLNWTSPIVGGPFAGFSGVWHLEGKFAPRTK